jgi:adenylate cyclase
MTQSRRLAAILATDVAGYSRLMGVDEEGTLELGVRYVLKGCANPATASVSRPQPRLESRCRR